MPACQHLITLNIQIHFLKGKKIIDLMPASWYYFYMSKLKDINDKKVTIRIPSKLHRVLKACSFYTDVSMNHLILEIIYNGLKNWAEQNITATVIDVDGVPMGSTEEEVEKILKGIDEAIKNLGAQLRDFYDEYI
jgi:hypothetical protein